MPKRLLLAIVLLAVLFEARSQVALRPKQSTKEEYRACLKEEDTLKAKREALNDESKTHSASLKRIQDEMRAHVATQPLPGRADDAAVDAFNEKIGLLNVRVEASNREAERLNLEQYKLNTQIAAANQRCAGMVVSYPDHEAVLKERAEARRQK
jgi:predicted  nucleic acid-binding Zn-ribbon protein